MLDDRLEGVEVAGGLFGESMALGQRTLEEPHGVGILPPTHSETTQVTEGPGADQSGEHAAAGIAGGRFQGLQDALIERLGLRAAAVTPEGVGQVNRFSARKFVRYSGTAGNSDARRSDIAMARRKAASASSRLPMSWRKLPKLPRFRIRSADVEDSRRLVMQCLGQLECSSVGLFRLCNAVRSAQDDGKIVVGGSEPPAIIGDAREIVRESAEQVDGPAEFVLHPGALTLIRLPKTQANQARGQLASVGRRPGGHGDQAFIQPDGLFQHLDRFVVLSQAIECLAKVGEDAGPRGGFRVWRSPTVPGPPAIPGRVGTIVRPRSIAR